MRTAFMMSPSAATIYIEGKKYIFPKEHPNFDKACAAAKAGNWEAVPGLVDLGETLKKLDPENIEISMGTATYAGGPIPAGYALQKLTKMTDPLPLLNFLKRFADNPSPISQDEAVAFFDKANLPLHPDGRFYAWKVVRNDYKDKHSGTFDNSVGQVLSMPREKVDPDRSRTCSWGFHVCSKGYIRSFHCSGDHLMKVLVDPADIVSIPADHNDEKMRVTGYEVVAEEAFENVDAFEDAPVRENPEDNSKHIPPPEVIVAQPQKRGFFARWFGLG